jgi:hypothetical protein
MLSCMRSSIGSTLAFGLAFGLGLGLTFRCALNLRFEAPLLCAQSLAFSSQKAFILRLQFLENLLKLWLIVHSC